MGTRLRVGLLLAAVCMALASCSPANHEGTGSKLVYGLTLAPSGLDPHIDVSS